MESHASRIEQVENGLFDPADSALPNPRAYSLAERMDEYFVPGVSIAIIENGEFAWAKGYGVRAVGQPGVIEPDTIFQAGSISKPIAALAILRLVESHNLDLDADANDYLTSWRVPPVDGWQPRLTLRHLLSHTGGTTVHGFMGYNHTEAVPNVLQILDGVAPANSDPICVDTLPGTHFRYSGGGTTIAQQLASDVAVAVTAACPSAVAVTDAASPTDGAAEALPINPAQKPSTHPPISLIQSGCGGVRIVFV